LSATVKAAAGEIVLGMCVTHTPRVAFPERAAPVFGEMIAAMRRAGETLRASDPDVAVLISAHWVTTFNVYVNAAERHRGILTAMECPDLLSSLLYDFPGDPELAAAVMREGRSAGVPVIAFDEPHYVEDYGTIVPLQYLAPDSEIPVVSISTCLTSTLEECFTLGGAIRSAIEQSGRRAAVLASSAFAHNVVRSPETWPTAGEREVDRSLIELLTGSQLDAARRFLPEFAAAAHYEQGGRPLATLLGALEHDYRGSLYGYGPSSGSGNPIIAFEPAQPARA
jgi:3,4-dihydroxyphenylacetate 2,3-dioxygenase